MARDTSVDIVDWKKSKLWSIPPVLSEDPPGSAEQSFILTQGIVYTIINQGTSLFQNISENEDDIIDFSLHGDPKGTWNQLFPGSFLKATGNLYMLNRTHKHNCKVAVTNSNCTCT